MSRRPAILSVWVLTILLASTPAWGESVRSSVEAQGMVRARLSGRTPPLNVGTVREVGQSYEVELVTSRGTLVDRLLLDKGTGRIRSLYGRMLLSFAPIDSPPPAPALGGS